MLPAHGKRTKALGGVILPLLGMVCAACAGPCRRSKEPPGRRAQSEFAFAAHGQCRIEIQPLAGLTVVLTRAPPHVSDAQELLAFRRNALEPTSEFSPSGAGPGRAQLSVVWGHWPDAVWLMTTECHDNGPTPEPSMTSMCLPTAERALAGPILPIRREVISSRRRCRFRAEACGA